MTFGPRDGAWRTYDDGSLSASDAVRSAAGSRVCDRSCLSEVVNLIVRIGRHDDRVPIIGHAVIGVVEHGPLSAAEVPDTHITVINSVFSFNILPFKPDFVRIVKVQNLVGCRKRCTGISYFKKELIRTTAALQLVHTWAPPQEIAVVSPDKVVVSFIAVQVVLAVTSKQPVVPRPAL